MSEIPLKNIKMLQSIGLSKSASLCYLVLLEAGQKRTKARYVGESAELSHSSLYRALEELIRKGFITEAQILRAKLYKAEPLSYALDNYATYQRTQLQALIKEQHAGVLQNSPLSRTISN